MSRPDRTNLILGAVIVAFALVLVFIWIPMDTTTGIYARVRRQYVIGDALAPTIAGVFLLIGGLMVALFERAAKFQPTLDGARFRFVAVIAAILALSFLIMRFAGPIAVELSNLITGQELGYRALRATVPWKYIGFFLGCTFGITGIISMTEGRLSWRNLGIGAAAAVVMIALYDLPFDTILLPPNGDV